MDQPFLIDPENAELAAGRVQTVPSGQSGCMLVFFSFFLIVGAPFFYLTGRGLHDWWRLRQAPAVQATVLSHETDDSGDGTSYYLRYTYEIPGPVRLERREQVGRKGYLASPPGTVLRVRYDPRRPDRAQSAHAYMSGFKSLALMALFLLLWAAAPAVFWLSSAKDLRRRWRLSRGAVRLQGRIVGARLEPDSDGDPWLHVDYHAISPGGKPISGEVKVARKDLKEAPRPGTLLTVLYADDATHLAL